MRVITRGAISTGAATTTMRLPSSRDGPLTAASVLGHSTVPVPLARLAGSQTQAAH
jgi:hypothetical protein